MKEFYPINTSPIYVLSEVSNGDTIILGVFNDVYAASSYSESKYLLLDTRHWWSFSKDNTVMTRITKNEPRITHIITQTLLQALGEILDFQYTNYKEETSIRRVIPLRVWYGSNKWHSNCWIMDAYDLDKQAIRSFNFDSIVKGKAV